MAKPDNRTRHGRDNWQHRGSQRPAFAIDPAPGQESVWDYPRPPAIAPARRRVRVLADGITIAESSHAVRVLETASPPTFYLPPDDVKTDLLFPTHASSFCEWKGHARYYEVRLEHRLIENAAWTYIDPFSEFAAIAGFFAFYPSTLDCWVGDERAVPQPGAYYGGWVTSDIVGPFKGEAGTGNW